ncbi:MAG: 4-(cytidine 5'-diphospho)-2-C-methyl-D-erythritol kinase [Limnohabitans sp.]|nr:4-(cytidine 5'-diphospho)-2-C-methyl-D-erythritol kinase [Limnohabitans sp.]
MNKIYDSPAPAKLNLFLHIVGRKDNGNHLLQSVFMLIDWWDLLSFEIRNDGLVSRSDEGSLALPEQDLSVKAALALQKASGTSQGVHIHLKKFLPAQAGMGGGSSNAATTLLALNQLWGLHWSTKQLAKIGLSLGADVPFFLHGTSAWVEGIGEKLTSIELPPASFVVVKPSTGLETRRIFQNPDLKRDTKPATISDFAARPFHFGCNDLQPVAQSLCSNVSKAIFWLQTFGLNARMTGTGSAVFAHTPSSVAFPKAPNDWSIKQCKNLDVHPLAMWASSDK